ncbi:MAG: type VI secretion system-associated FHA domain protein TagH [Pseudomonadota bacterium]
MPVIVTVRNLESGGPSSQVTLPEPVATIGRNANCDVVLLDPEKHISRLHATVESRPDGHILTVNSQVNPIVVDGAAYALGERVALRDGARVVMHPFEVGIRITAAPARAVGGGARGGHGAGAGAAAAASPFSWLDDVGGAPPAQVDPFGLNLAPARAAPVAGAPDIFYLPPPGAQSQALVPDLFASVGAGLNAPASLDPMALLGGAPGRAGGSGHAGSLSLFGEGPGGGSPLVDFGGHLRQTGSAAPDHVHDHQLPFQPAQLGQLAQAAAFAQPVQPVQPAQPAPAAADASLGLDWLAAYAPAAPVPASAPEAAEPWDAAPAQAAQLRNLAPAEVAQPWPAAPAAAAVTVPAAVPAHGASAGATAAFLRGLGESGFTVAPEHEAEFFEKAGTVVQVAVQGLVTLLLARAEIKKELRADERTMLASRANNPLKFMGSSQEAVRFLFDPDPPNAAAFLAPALAIEEACDELVAHELALVAGMRAAVIGAIKRFDPDVFEAKAGKLGGLIPGGRKAKLWDLHVEQYAKMRHEMSDNLDRLFEREFLGAYTEQLRRMSKK